MKFSEVIDALQKGGIATRCSSAAFAGKWIVKQIPQTVPADVVPKMTSLPEIIKPLIAENPVADPASKGAITYHDQVIIVTMDILERVTATYYIPTWEDIFADDWTVQVPAESAVEEEEMAMDYKTVDMCHGKAAAGKKARPETADIGPRWDEKRNGVFVPIINKVIQLKDLTKHATWGEAMRLAAKVGGNLMTRKEADIIHYFLEDINSILEEHGGDPITGAHWTSQEYNAAGAWGVSFGSGYVHNYYKCGGYAARAVVAY